LGPRKAAEEWHRWMQEQEHPFAKLTARLYFDYLRPKLGVIDVPPESLRQEILETAAGGASYFLERQDRALRDLREALKAVDTFPLACFFALGYQIMPWGT
jgi:hypothetical protein